MYTIKQSRGALWMGMAAVLTMTSAVAAQFQGSSAQSTVSDPPSSSADVVGGSAPFMGTNGQIITVNWIDLGFALSGVAGDPKLKGSGTIAPGERAKIVLKDAAPLSLAVLFVSLDAAPTPFKGGTLVPDATSFSLVIATDYEGRIELPISGSANLPAGYDIVMQYAITDAAAPQGVSLSNALQTSTH